MTSLSAENSGAARPRAGAVPPDGALPESALRTIAERDFGIYIHVPFCASRCGYCDFNTYTPAELGSTTGVPDFDTYVGGVHAELALAQRVLGTSPPVRTVFFGGGTPTLLPASELAAILQLVDDTFGLAADAEITTEANPESVSPATLRHLRGAGFNRISLGMQSVASNVLATLERRHTPGRAIAAAAEAQAAGFEHINLDLIYGTAGESDTDWLASVRAVIDAGVDHVSAYALIVEDGTRLARQVSTGMLAAPDDDVLADRYLLADTQFSAAGLSWYEVSNWAKSQDARCRHNLGYWRSDNWWGIGPGAHSHVGGVRWWNRKHPASYATALTQGQSPAAEREVLDDTTRALESLMLGLRVKEGLALASLTAAQQRVVEQKITAGLLDHSEAVAGRAVLTQRGRLLADAVVRDLAIT